MVGVWEGFKCEIKNEKCVCKWKQAKGAKLTHEDKCNSGKDRDGSCHHVFNYRLSIFAGS